MISIDLLMKIDEKLSHEQMNVSKNQKKIGEKFHFLSIEFHIFIHSFIHFFVS